MSLLELDIEKKESLYDRLKYMSLLELDIEKRRASITG